MAGGHGHEEEGEEETGFDGFPYLPVIGIAVIFVLSLLGSIVPPFICRWKKDWDFDRTFLFRLASGFAAGTILAVGFVHSFPEGLEDLSSSVPPLPEFPWAGLFAMLGALVTFAVEESVTRYQERKHASSGKSNEPHEHSAILISKHEFYTEMLVLLFGLTFHSFFVGIALGLSPDDVGLFIAIIAHQLFEGIALGLRISRAKLPKNWQIWLIDIIFALSCPLGIALGLILVETVQTGTTLTIVTGTFNSFSAGILIFISLVHMMHEEMQQPATKERPVLQYAMYLGFLLGAAFLSVLAIWA